MPVEYFAALLCAWLASYFVHSTLLLGAAWIVTRRLPPRYDRLGELIWRLALGVPVITALGQQLVYMSARSDALSAPLHYTPAALTVTTVPGLVWLIVATVWIGGAALGLAQLVWLQRSLQATIRSRTPVAPERRNQIRTGSANDSIPLSVVENLSVPLALRNEICLPAWIAEGMAIDEFRAVIAHELAHVRRHDAIWRPLVAMATRLFFFQPLNWLASAQLRELSECICDEEAIEATDSALPLALALEAVAERTLRRPVNVSLVPAMDPGKSFTLMRIMRILSGPDAQRIRHAQSLAALAMAVGVASVLLAPRVELPSIAFIRYTINAQDPAGHFTLTLEKGKVVGATISGRILQRGQVTQDGRALRIVDPSAGVFSLQLTPSGGVRWNPRQSAN